MGDFVREAGFAIFPVLALGLAALGLALWHAVVPSRRLPPLVVGLGAATLLMALLGTVLGAQLSFAHAGELAEADRWLVLVGLRESLQNLVAALALLVVTTLVTTVGSYRLARRAPAPAGVTAPA